MIEFKDSQTFLSHLESLDIKISAEGHRLKIDAPKGGLSDELRALLKARKPELLEFCKRDSVAKQKSNGYALIKPTARTEELYASFAQQRLWFLDQLAENKSAIYNVPLFLRASGELHTPSLIQAFNEVIHRHEVLRTVFQEPEKDDKEPYQHILPALILNVPITDLSQLNEQEREQQIQSMAHKEAEHLFDLSKGPLVRLSIIKAGTTESVLLFHFHHTVFDGLSVAIFLREIKSLYETFLQGKPSPLPPLKIQYADYSQWQRQSLSGKTLEKHLKFWKAHLAGAPPFIELPADHARPLNQTLKGARISFEIDQTLTKHLRNLSQQNNVTLFMTLYAAFAVLLARYTDEKDLVIGMPVANRNHQQLESLIGFFANTLALRFRIAQDLAFTDLLQQVKENVLAALQHQDIPFEKLIDELKIEKSLAHNPLFQVMFTFQEAYLEDFSLSDLTLSPLSFEQSNAKFDLSFMVREHKKKLVGIFEYNADLFEAETIKRIAGNFDVLLTAIIDHPEHAISQLPVLSEQDIQQLQAWNDTTTDYPQNQTIIDLFEQQVTKNPDHIALVFEDQSLNYQQLNAKANQLAHYLLSITTPSGSALLSHNPLVAIAVERSMEMVIGLLAILKAGGAYIPIDPSYPKARIRYLLDDSAAPLLLTQRHLSAPLSLEALDHECVMVCLDEVDLAEQSIENPRVKSHAEDLAYVIYTSGSTGKPKGVMVENSNVVNFLDAFEKQAPHITPLKGIFTVPFSFDLSVWEIFSQLCYGGTLHVLSQDTLLDTDLLTNYLLNKQISSAYIAPALLDLIASNLKKQGNPLQRLLVGVEPISQKVLQEFRTLSNELYIINGYGPTEATVCATFYKFTHAIENERRTPIGKAVANYQIYILNTNNQPQPPGFPGELCIAGVGLARGYLNRPDLTAEKFIEVELFGHTERIYKTGDVARWLPDGNLEYLGRLDHQVKLRGFRIELGEIEAVLLQHNNVKQATVVLHEKGDNPYLAAYVTLIKPLENIAHTLRTWLETRVPNYMLPTFFVQLDSMPLTPNGKINRKALPEPEMQHSNRQFVAPRDSLELRLVLLWEKILGISPVSIVDNFFEVGGDSLLSIRLISNINAEFGVRIPLHMIFQNSTIEQLASMLRQDGVTSDWSPLVCLQAEGPKTPLFCVHAAGGIVFRYIQTASLLGTERPFYGIQARGIEPGDEMYASIEEMAMDYVQAIRNIQPKGPYLLSGWSFGGTVAFEMARILEQAGETVPYLLMIDSPSPFIDSYEKDEVEFLLERLRSAAGLALDDVYQQNSREARMLYLFKEQKLAGMFAPDMDINDAELRLKIHMHHNEILCQYRPAGSFNGKIIFFKPTETIPFDTKMQKPIPAWEAFAGAGIEVHEAPGNHFNMFSPTNTPVLAKKMKECIERTGL